MRATISALLFCACAVGQADSNSALERQLQAILPSEDERVWLSVPWQPQLRKAVLAAKEANKPIFLWAMNGHPLGQT